MATNQIIGGEGLTANPNLVERERNDKLLSEALARAQQEREFQARYQAEQQQRADAQQARAQQMMLAQQENARQAQAQELANQRAQQAFDYQAKRDMLGDALEREKMRSEDAYRNSALSNALQIAGMKDTGITPYQQGQLDIDMKKLDLDAEKLRRESGAVVKQRAKDTSLLADTVATTDNQMRLLEEARASAEKLPQGIVGNLKVDAMKAFDPTNPILAEWQKVKAVLLDGQLLNTAKTKGAISDMEMKLLGEAVANDNVSSLPRIKVALDRIASVIDADRKGAIGAYKANYGEESLAEVLGRMSEPKSTGGVTVEWLD